MAKSDGKGSDVEVLESGNIYFCYRPKVEQEEVAGLDEVQRFYLVLKPHGKTRYRLLTIGRKRLPDIAHQGQQAWGFVESVSRDAQAVEEQLREQYYRTKTRGERELPAARPVGEGVYDILRHGDHTHLVYALELPKQPGPAQRDLHIAPEASYILQIKNPTQKAPARAGLEPERKPRLPKKLQERFGGRRFMSAEPPDFLDYEGTELLLITASDDTARELGVELDPQQETEATAEIIRDLRMRKSHHPMEPLFTGRWQ